MAYKNIEDRKAASKRHYEANKERYLARNKRYRQEINAYINDLKSNAPCTDCKKLYPYYVMDFDHLNGHTKLGLVSAFAKSGRIGALKKELSKCELVCANCHRQRTHSRIQDIKSRKDVKILLRTRSSAG